MKIPIALYTQQPSVFQGLWTVSEVLAALDAHEHGEFSRSALLWDALGRMPRVKGCLDTRVGALLSKGGGIPFSIQPADSTNKQAASAYAKQVDGWWWDCIPDWVLRRILSDAVGLGVAFCRQAWLINDEGYFPSLEPWPASHFYKSFSDGLYHASTLQGDVTIQPDDPNWFIYEPGGPQSWMGGVVRCLGANGVATSDTYRDWARYCERHGLPIIALDEPTEADDASKQNFFRRVQNLGGSGVLRLPKDANGKGFDAKIIEPQSDTWAAFQGFLQWLATDVAIAIKGNNLTTDVQGGSFAAATAHRQVDQLVLASDAEGLSTGFRKGPVSWWGRFNVRGWQDKLAPWPTWDTKPPEDLVGRATMLQAAGLAFQSWNAALAATGQQVDAKAYADQFRIPITALPKPEPAALPAASAPAKAALPANTEPAP